jgi:tetratricopeptide (TPR) repeat protein
MKTTAITVFALAMMVAQMPAADIQSTHSDFQQALAYYYGSSGPANLVAASNVIRLAVAMEQLPPIPEEARKHYVMGTTLLKEAKTSDDYAQACAELTQAIANAPWWPDARYNRALAYAAAGNYADAIQQFNLYRLFKLPEAEARAVQDRIYVLEAKQQKAAKQAQIAAQQSAEEAKARAELENQRRQLEQAKNAEQARLDSLQGVYSCTYDSGPVGGMFGNRSCAGIYRMTIRGGEATKEEERTKWADQKHEQALVGYWFTRGHGIVRGRQFTIRDEFDKQHNYDCTISEDGRQITENWVEEGRGPRTQTYNRER